MKKKLLVLVIGLCLSLCGCNSDGYTSASDISSDNVTFAGDYFTVIKEWGDLQHSYKLMYANDTKVKYLMVSGRYHLAITELHNPDGSLQVYEEVEE